MGRDPGHQKLVVLGSGVFQDSPLKKNGGGWGRYRNSQRMIFLPDVGWQGWSRIPKNVLGVLGSQTLNMKVLRVWMNPDAKKIPLGEGEVVPDSKQNSLLCAVGVLGTPQKTVFEGTGPRPPQK